MHIYQQTTKNYSINYSKIFKKTLKCSIYSLFNGEDNIINHKFFIRRSKIEDYSKLFTVKR